MLEGSVRRDGNRVRITAELIDACDGFTIWSETYEREMHGIFALQDEITRSIVDTLSLEFFERALEKDPQFSRSWTGIAKSWLWLADAYVAPLEAYAKVRDAALCAVVRLRSSQTRRHPIISLLRFMRRAGTGRKR